MDTHLSTVSMFQRGSGHNVFLCTFPITVAQISLTNHPSSYLPSLVTYNEWDVVVILQLQRVRKRGGWPAGKGCMEGRLEEFA